MTLSELEHWCNRANSADDPNQFVLTPKEGVLLEWRENYDDFPFIVQDIAFFEERGTPMFNINRLWDADSVWFDLAALEDRRFIAYVQATELNC